MTKRTGWALALMVVFVVTTGCHSARNGRPTAMMPAAPVDNTPRAKAVGPARGADPAMSMSTALAPLKKASGEEESVYEFPIPKAPTDSVPVVPKTNLPPPPPELPASPTSAMAPLAAPPPALPPANAPVSPPPMAAPPKQTSDNSGPTTGTPTLAGLVPVEEFPRSDKIIVIGAEEPGKGVRGLRPTGIEDVSKQTQTVKRAVADLGDGVTEIDRAKQKLIARMYQDQPPALEAPPLDLPPPIPVPEVRIGDTKNLQLFDTKPEPKSPAVVAPKLPIDLAPSSSPAAGTEDIARLRALYEKAKVTEASMSSYTLRLRRREAVGGKMRPEEVVVAKFRRDPFSVYLKWIGDEHKNREVVYVKGQHEDKIHTLLAPGDHFLFAGKAMAFPLDNPLIKSNSRYPVTDGGLGPLITRFGKLVAALEVGDSREGTAKSLGKVKRPEFEEPVEGVLMDLPTSTLFPKGGRRFMYLDVENGLPVLIVTMDDQNREVEYYCHERIQYPVNLDDDDFNPAKLWKK